VCGLPAGGGSACRCAGRLRSGRRRRALSRRIDAAEQLTALLDLDSVGLAVRGAIIYGRGATASVDLHLSDDMKIAFESFRDVGTASRLALELAATCGATPNLNNQQVLRAIALIRALGEHRAQVTDDERVVAWGIESSNRPRRFAS
jgi:hypothetical protein